MIDVKPPAREAIASASVAPQSSHQPAPGARQKRPYPPATRVPTQSAVAGIRFDFNQGCRVSLPVAEHARWRVTLRDLDSGNLLFRNAVKGPSVHSSKRWFVRFGIEIHEVDESGAVAPEPLFRHEYDARGREVLVQFPVGTLGDVLAWFPAAARFAEVHDCRLTCAMSGLIIPLLRGAYPHIRFVTHEELVARSLAETFYATYCLGLFFDDADCNHQPTDFRLVGLHRTAAYILGIAPVELPPRLALSEPGSDHGPEPGPPIAEPYVVIAVQASTHAKMWNNPQGWRAAIEFLKARGYRVICIDQKPVQGSGHVWTHLPHGAEDETGDRPLTERARWLRHAAAFVGVSSGLSWLAWAAGCPVVLISGFTHPTNEFATPYRVNNWHVCNSCWNDPRLRFDHADYLWCPRHNGTPRQFECSRLITAEAVLSALGCALPMPSTARAATAA